LSRRTIALAALWLGLAPLSALRAQEAVPEPGPLFTYRDALLAGGFALIGVSAYRLDEHYAQRLQDSSTQANSKLQTLAKLVTTTVAPGSLYIGGGMYVAGRLAKNEKLASLGLHGTEALLVGESVAYVIKNVVGRQRPYVRPRNARSYELLRGVGRRDYQSFPSGHTVAAFAAAAAVTAETSRNDPSSTWIVAPIMYGGATLAGVSRMYNNQHWASDVVIGAAIGTFAGLKIVRFHDSRPHSGLDRIFLTATLVPVGDGHALRLGVMPASLVERR
jgi:membrane-associated phospholipid phosphatase